jgi:hypothetical protein
VIREKFATVKLDCLSGPGLRELQLAASQIKKSPMGRTDRNQRAGQSMQPSVLGPAAREDKEMKLFTLNDAKLQVFTEGSRIYWLPIHHKTPPSPVGGRSN